MGRVGIRWRWSTESSRAARGRTPGHSGGFIHGLLSFGLPSDSPTEVWGGQLWGDGSDTADGFLTCAAMARGVTLGE